MWTILLGFSFLIEFPFLQDNFFVYVCPYHVGAKYQAMNIIWASISNLLTPFDFVWKRTKGQKA